MNTINTLKETNGHTMVTWCQQHDWGSQATYNAETDSIDGIMDIHIDRDGMVREDVISLPANFADLKAFANY